jgi:hypothetical protein
VYIFWYANQNALAEDSENNIHKIYLKGKFIVSLFTNKGFGFPLEVGVPTMLDVITQCIEFLLTNDRYHPMIYQSILSLHI